ncbi:hypothetical protein N7470_007926 [Penicillium chermesinum]|nr:hypothetical protein N7470_007926 [Penicillium chermesinum]
MQPFRFGRSSISDQSPATHDATLGFLHGLFRRRGDSLSSPSQVHHTESRNPPRAQLDHENRKPRSHDSSCHHGSGQPRSPSSSEPLSANIHGEPKQPGNIQDYLESRLEAATKVDGSNGSTRGPDISVLTIKDYKAIFSGAPHFMLEKGKNGRYYPEVIFPWDLHNPSIQRLLDRKLLSHRSYTLCTLHAHLPIPDDWAVKDGVPIHLENFRWTGRTKRATFDIGVFEVPNMLASNGREPGTVGLRHFLEVPIADAIRYPGPGKPHAAPGLQQLSSLPAVEAFDVVDTYDRPYAHCSNGTVFDRRQLIRDGPTAWRRIGVRDIDLRVLVQRIHYIKELREQILADGSTLTLLDAESPRELHHSLHGHLKSQIKTLATVLATPGAWIDFSLPEWRLRAGQILWEAPPHQDGDGPSHEKSDVSTPSWVNSGMERKWLLVQLVLAAELILRLDAFVRKGMLHDPHAGLMTAQELQQFDQLREGKVNWDLIVVRRFFNNLQIPQPELTAEQPDSGNKAPTKPHRISLREIINRHISTGPALGSAWSFQITSSPSRIHRQLEGLYVFAENIGWPNVDMLHDTLEKKLRKGQELALPDLNDNSWARGQNQFVQHSAVQGAKDDMYTRSPSRWCLQLYNPCEANDDPHFSDRLGWISRSWLSGFVIAGEGICHLLMGTILENDADAIQQLGATANFYGGFVYKGRSWWSKACIVGRVLSALQGSKTCMGWVGSDLGPYEATDQTALGPGWFEVHTEDVPSASRHPRIKHGGKVTLESSPLGVGDITAQSFSLPLDPQVTAQAQVDVGMLTLSLANPGQRCITLANEACLSFTVQDPAAAEQATMIRFPLRYNVRFVSAHECRPPRCFTPQRQGPAVSDSHPLHQSFPYKFVPVARLSPNDARPATSSSLHTSPEVVVIDARGCRSKEALARAWCATVGAHSVIGRVGRTCVACCVREARAIGVQVVIRVGD